MSILTSRSKPVRILICCSAVLAIMCGIEIIFNVIKNWRTKDIGNQTENYNYNIHYLINNRICGTKEVDLLILIPSEAGNIKRRDFIRSTWGQSGIKANIEVLFLLGEPEYYNDERYQKESDLHHDIIQGDFLDSLYYLTKKHVMGLQWVSRYCSQAMYILKIDDDIFMDIYNLFDFVDQHLSTDQLNNSIACYITEEAVDVRHPENERFISDEEFPEDNLSHYCNGWAYLTTPYVARLLSETAETLPYFWVDSVHITGAVAKAAGVELVEINNLFALDTSDLKDWVNSEGNKWNHVFVDVHGDLELSNKAHEKAHSRYLAKTTTVALATSIPSLVKA